MRLRNIRGSKDVIASCPFVVQEPESCRGRWVEVFGNENPIHIEVGMGKGRFLMDMAVLHPEINYMVLRCTTAYCSARYRNVKN